jgi:hypothetical protein
VGQGLSISGTIPCTSGTGAAKGKVTMGKNAISAPSRLTNLVQIPAQTGASDEHALGGFRAVEIQASCLNVQFKF